MSCGKMCRVVKCVVCRNNIRNRRERIQGVLGKWWVRGCCHICFPKSCCDGKQAQLVLLVDGGGVQINLLWSR